MLQPLLMLLFTLTVIGCQNQPERPNFLVRSLQDCADGQRAACQMLEALVVKGDQTTERNRPGETQVQRNVDAIMKGIDRARSSPPAGRWHIAPTGLSDIPEHR